MTSGTVFGSAIVAVAVFVATPRASAACNPHKFASTYNGYTGQISYWHSPFGQFGQDSDLVGRSWQLGAGTGAWDSAGGALPCSLFSPFLYFGLNGINLELDLGSCGSGCPADGSTLAVLAQHRPTGKAAFLLATATEGGSSIPQFDYSSLGDLNLIEIPRPRVLTYNDSVPGQVTLLLAFPAVTGGLYGPNAASAVTGYRVLAAQTATNPGHNAASYPIDLGTFAAPGGGTTTGLVTLDCTSPQHHWVVTQILFESGGVIQSDVVSDAVLSNCDPALAHPRPIFPKKTDSPLDPPGVQ